MSPYPNIAVYEHVTDYYLEERLVLDRRKSGPGNDSPRNAYLRNLADFCCGNCGKIYYNNRREHDFIQYVGECQACHFLGLAEEWAPEGASEEDIEVANQTMRGSA